MENFEIFRGDASPLLGKLALAMVSEDLMEAPRKRKEFIKNPAAYIEKHYGGPANQNEMKYFSYLANLFKNGFAGILEKGEPSQG
jgi:hypothetical protein